MHRPGLGAGAREMGQGLSRNWCAPENLIEETLRLEETRFPQDTGAAGLTILDEKSASLKKKATCFDGDTAFYAVRHLWLFRSI